MTAGQFARLGYDVSVQYGADQPEYDLIVSKEDRFLKISVKGSQDGSWGLTQKFIKNADYHRAVDLWLQSHNRKTIFCFVQFKDKLLEQLPNLYLAKPDEVAKRLNETANGRGDTILYENYTYKTKRAAGFGTTDKIPNNWKFSRERLELLINELG
ncbi:MAG: hypothetical protein JST52_03000 [Bacteroidetes bacterium]|nr:hypothetical protein [Bacteroidota bacterium]MBS1739946.1 hypothetical protein [Bacteroidota bacterium]